MTDAHGYPRPQLQRRCWTSLNGEWEFALDSDGRWARPGDVVWNATITVPFAPETSASGIGDTGCHRAVWYQRLFDAPTLAPGERLLLHFGAVDYAATVWINGMAAGRHEGGFTPFTLDITAMLSGPGAQRLVVHAEDDPADLAKPRGKQDWQREPHSIWYPRTTGIWQTVWLECVPETAIHTVRWTSSLEAWDLGIEVILDGIARDDLRLEVQLSVGEGRDRKLLADDTYAVIAGEVHRRVALSDPGIDDFRNELLWSPKSPTLIHARLRLCSPQRDVLDEVESYTALRSVGVQGDRFVLNGRPFPLRMVLDQGYWPESGLTAPDDAALRRDVELAKAMGFNGVRKHQKIEDPRYLYWADTLGLVVWEEMPSAYRFTKRSVTRLTREWTEVIERDSSHPCIISWVPFNESWGVPDLPNNPAQRDYVRALYYLTKTLDGTRPVIGNDGWESVATDIIGIHDYDPRPERITARYSSGETIPQLFTRERPGGRLLTVDGQPHAGQPLMLTEFGGIAFTGPEKREETWGYSRSDTAEKFMGRYAALLEAVRSLPLLAGFCYTQFADTYQEANGLLYADRTPKFPLEEMRRINARPVGADVTIQERLEAPNCAAPDADEVPMPWSSRPVAADG
ncbi:MAG: glycoside hydrolase family 2 [Chloroflexota bacterium]|nr:glycoside hydrolase family 2 [Chloroflexota bacterium]